MSATTGGEGDRSGRAAPGPATETTAAEDARISVLLHDLRTPLSAMRTAVEIIETDPTTPRQASALRTLEMAIDALLSMTTEGLAGGGVLPADAPRGVVGVIRSVADLFAADARARGLYSRCEIDAALDAHAVADPLALRRILSVLYDNALKYTGEGGIALTARLACEEAGPFALVGLADTGIGIPEDERPLLFRARRRGELAPRHGVGQRPRPVERGAAGGGPGRAAGAGRQFARRQPLRTAPAAGRRRRGGGADRRRRPGCPGACQHSPGGAAAAAGGRRQRGQPADDGGDARCLRLRHGAGRGGRGGARPAAAGGALRRGAARHQHAGPRRRGDAGRDPGIAPRPASCR